MLRSTDTDVRWRNHGLAVRGEMLEHDASLDKQIPAEWSPLAAATWLQAFNSAWLGGRWPQLARLLCPDVELADLEAGTATLGRANVVAVFRRRYARLNIHEFAATEVVARRLGGVGIIHFHWSLDWHESSELIRRFGRTAVGLRLFERPWKALWIKQGCG